MEFEVELPACFGEQLICVFNKIYAKGVGRDRGVELPSSLTNQKGFWNPQVRGRCFEWCLRAALEIGSLDSRARLRSMHGVALLR